MPAIEQLCVILILIFTCLISSRCHLTTENWTYLLLRDDKIFLVLFGTLGSLLFCFLLYRFSVYVHRPIFKYCILTSVNMPCSLLFVFEPLNHPIQSNLHLLFAYLYFFCVNGCFIHSLFFFHLSKPNQAKIIETLYLIILILSAALYIHFMSINTLFELFFTLSMTTLLSFTLTLIHKH